MAYTINNYNGTILANVADGTLDTTTSLKLAGRNYAGYGEVLNENLLWLMQSFANSSAPSNPVPGQIWYKSSNSTINIYNGSTWFALAAAADLTGSLGTVYAAINANVVAVNGNIDSNVAILAANAAVQDTNITNLWANAATQNTSIVNLWANAAVQDTYIGEVNANVSAANAVIATLAPIASPTFTGTPIATTPSLGDNSTKIATTAYVMTQDTLRKSYVDTVVNANVALLTTAIDNAVSVKANTDSPTLTGTPRTQTPLIGDNSTRLATTAYVMSQDAIRRVYVDTNINSNIATLNTAVNNNLSLKAPIANPTFTGTVNVPTPAIGDSSTKAASTSFVVQTVSGSSSTWQGSHRFISGTPPDSNQGIDGDFWFQYL